MHPFARRLLDARAAGRPIEDAAAAAPADVDEAMRAQADAFRAGGEAVAGWKVAVRPGFGPVAAPIARSRTFGTGEVYAAPLGCLGIELEIALRMAATPPRSADRAALLQAAGAILVGVEVCASRLADPATAPFPAFLADDMANDGYVLGDAAPIALAASLGRLVCRVAIDGRTLFEGPAAHPNGNPLAPALAWVASPIDGLGGVRPGQFVTTGALCGMLRVEGPCRIDAAIEGIGAATFRLG